MTQDERDKLIQKVLERMLKDLVEGDYSSLEVLLARIPDPELKEYLGESK